ncbi:hypothetical protein FGG08_004404 [Glutinoglossum americanum]|uniref:Acyl-CoA thioesterase n=1 Tax=Glutinoglossum americanum TaxID=1670608 RepID=A0A9P8HWJ4_9PEZI|nr:hypothetical protein FGG08_004404 [Glutinoglossum americanum]
MAGLGKRIDDPLEASSYFAPGGGEIYAPLRNAVTSVATEMGYDTSTFTEHGVVWADDQDPFGHLKYAAFPHLFAVCNFRLFESFSRSLGPELYEEFSRARGVGIVTKSFSIDLKRQVKYPDALLIAVRVTEMKPDRYHCITTIWSYSQQAIVAETSGYAVFFDYKKQRPANLVEYGGRYKELYDDLTRRAAAGNAMYGKWLERNPKARPRVRPAEKM